MLKFRSEILVLLVAFFLVFALYFKVKSEFDSMSSKIGSLESEVSVHNNLLSGKAQYMPGAACVIATGPDTTPAQIVNYARACAKSHEDWLTKQQEAQVPATVSTAVVAP